MKAIVFPELYYFEIKNAEIPEINGK